MFKKYPISTHLDLPTINVSKIRFDTIVRELEQLRKKIDKADRCSDEAGLLAAIEDIQWHSDEIDEVIDIIEEFSNYEGFMDVWEDAVHERLSDDELEEYEHECLIIKLKEG